MCLCSKVSELSSALEPEAIQNFKNLQPTSHVSVGVLF